MRHRKDGRQFGRNTSHRRAMFRNLAANLINHERIVTTDAKAKELRRVTDKLITKAKRLGAVAYTPQLELSAKDKVSRLHVSRLIGAFLPRWGVERDGETKRDLVEKVIVDLSKRMAGRPGGYTRIIKLGPRRGDGANMSVIELVDAPPPTVEEETDLEAQTAEEPADGADEAAGDEAEGEAAADDETEAETDDK
jgi:large subunit ribosomal protein L17